MFSYYKRLKKDLDNCVNNGIINSTQAESIYDFICSQKSKFLKTNYVLPSIAGFFISIGIILVISANWDKISDFTKIFSYLLIYFICGIITINYSDGKLIGISSEILWFFMPIIGFGLYGQIFQISSDPLKPFILWAFISAPLVYLSQKKYLNYLFEILVFGILFYTLSDDTLFSLTNRGLNFWKLTGNFLIQIILLAFIGFMNLQRNGKISKYFIWLVLFWILFFSVAVNEKMRYIAVPLSVLLIILNSEKEVLDYKSTAAFLFAIYIFTFKDYFYELPCKNVNDFLNSIAYLCFISSYLLTFIKLRMLKYKVFTSFIYTAIILSIIMFVSPREYSFLLSILMNFIFIGAAIGVILYGDVIQSKKFINLGMTAVFILSITRFVDLFREFGLMESGFGFIWAGAFLLVIAHFVNKYRKKLIENIEK